MMDAPNSEGIIRDRYSSSTPEQSLAKLRSDIEDTLWRLERLWDPNHEPKSGVAPGSSLVSSGIIDKKALASIRKVLELADPSTHGKTVNPTDAANIVEAGVAVIIKLEELSVAADEKASSRLNRNDIATLIYKFLELSLQERWRIATELELAPDIDAHLDRKEFTRTVFLNAKNQNKILDLTNLVNKIIA